jgi:hypothetical protein
MNQQPKGIGNSGSRWKRLLGAFLSAALLLPVPAFAFTWANNSNWTASGTPVNVVNTLGMGFGAVTGQPDSLFIQPTATSNTATSITLTRDFFPASGNPSMSVNPVQLSNFTLNTGTSLKIAVWTTIGPTSNEGDIIGTSATPLTLNGTTGQFLNNQFGTGPSLASGTKYTLHVQFAITSGNWSTFSTNTRLVANFVD